MNTLVSSHSLKWMWLYVISAETYWSISKHSFISILCLPSVSNPLTVAEHTLLYAGQKKHPPSFSPCLPTLITEWVDEKSHLSAFTGEGKHWSIKCNAPTSPILPQEPAIVSSILEHWRIGYSLRENRGLGMTDNKEHSSWPTKTGFV